jgi:hypothetical protein
MVLIKWELDFEFIYIYIMESQRYKNILIDFLDKNIKEFWQLSQKPWFLAAPLEF